MRSSVSLFDHPEADLCAAPLPSAQAGHSAISVAPVMPTPGTGNISARLPPTHVFDRHVYDPGAPARCSCHAEQKPVNGRSRGGLTSKIHAVVDTTALPVQRALTAVKRTITGSRASFCLAEVGDDATGRPRI
jgi:hypothetical protein